jgi:hypothetical protein
LWQSIVGFFESHAAPEIPSDPIPDVVVEEAADVVVEAVFSELVDGDAAETERVEIPDVCCLEQLGDRTILYTIEELLTYQTLGKIHDFGVYSVASNAVVMPILAAADVAAAIDIYDGVDYVWSYRVEDRMFLLHLRPGE